MKNLFYVACAALIGLGAVLTVVPVAHAENARDKNARVLEQQRAAQKAAAEKKEAEGKAPAATPAPAKQ